MTAIPQNPEVIEVEAPVGWKFEFSNVMSIEDMTVHRCILIGMVFVDGRQETVTLPETAAVDFLRAVRTELEGPR